MNTIRDRIRRRLERAELENLRTAVADLARRVDQLESDLARANDRTYDAERSADMWEAIAEAENKNVTLVLHS